MLRSIRELATLTGTGQVAVLKNGKDQINARENEVSEEGVVEEGIGCLLRIRVSQMALQTPQAADITLKSAGSSPAGRHVTRASSKHAWKANPTARNFLHELNFLN